MASEEGSAPVESLLSLSTLKEFWHYSSPSHSIYDVCCSLGYACCFPCVLEGRRETLVHRETYQYGTWAKMGSRGWTACWRTAPCCILGWPLSPCLAWSTLQHRRKLKQVYFPFDAGTGCCERCLTLCGWPCALLEHASFLAYQDSIHMLRYHWEYDIINDLKQPPPGTVTKVVMLLGCEGVGKTMLSEKLLGGRLGTKNWDRLTEPLTDLEIRRLKRQQGQDPYSDIYGGEGDEETKQFIRHDTKIRIGIKSLELCHVSRNDAEMPSAPPVFGLLSRSNNKSSQALRDEKELVMQFMEVWDVPANAVMQTESFQHSLVSAHCAALLLDCSDLPQSFRRLRKLYAKLKHTLPSKLVVVMTKFDSIGGMSGKENAYDIQLSKPWQEVKVTEGPKEEVVVEVAAPAAEDDEEEDGEWGGGDDDVSASADNHGPAPAAPSATDTADPHPLDPHAHMYPIDATLSTQQYLDQVRCWAAAHQCLICPVSSNSNFGIVTLKRLVIA